MTFQNISLAMRKIALTGVVLGVLGSFSFVSIAAASTAQDKVTNTTPSYVDPATSSNNCKDVSKCDLITRYLNPFIKFLSAFVGVAVVISIVIGGIQYASSGGDPQKVAAAKGRIINSLIALVTFIFLFALLNFLIPGGLI